MPLSPPRWTPAEMEKARQSAITVFVAERTAEGTKQYETQFETCLAIVRQLFAETDDLASFRGEVLVAHPALLDAARFLAGPPVSADDLDTLAAGRLTGRKTLDPTLADRAISVIQMAFDPVRLPWVREDRMPSEDEVERAQLWTASIWAVERLRTSRRTEASRRQEQAVVAALEGAEFTRVDIRRPILILDQLERGTFCRETALDGSKCDVPLRLHDGRLLALECKVSNTMTNSVKRLIREVGGKANLWRREFGQQVVTGAVLAGVYKLGNLVDAQDTYGVAIFWEHDLSPLVEFVRTAI